MSDPVAVRVEPVGSLVRPAWLEGAELGRARGQVAGAQLHVLQDRAVDEALARQKSTGLRLVTDGELRRMPLLTNSAKGAGSWRRGWARQLLPGIHDEALGLINSGPMPHRHGTQGGLAVDEPEAAASSTAVEEYLYAASHTSLPVKVSLLGPERTAQGLASVVDRSRYPCFDDLVTEVVRIERDIIGELAGAGCSHVQLDVPGYAAYEDPGSWGALRGRGMNPLGELRLSVQADNAVIADTQNISFGLHVCRRGLRGRWQQATTYDEVAEAMLSQLQFQRLLLDYGPEATGFETLRFVPRHTTVVLGLVSTTDARVESADDLVRQVEEATAYIDEDQLAIGPQCGFAGPVGHHDVSEDTQWRKFDALVEAANRFWG